MSSKGAYLRGEKWYFLNNKSTEGLGEDQIKDVNFYLDAQKDKEVKSEVKPKTKEKK